MKAAVLAAFFLIQAAGAEACTVTRVQYLALQTGIKYPDAIKILGCEGDEMSSSEIGGFSTVMYMWRGAGGTGANMNAMFQNGKLITKAQFGLK